jgi:type II secretory pathway pseudopilin PulG
MNKLLLLLFKFKKVTPRKEAGFTTLEILISLIIALLFVAVSMQSLVYAMAMKVQAQEKQRANELIQEDIERINRLGSTITPGAVASTTTIATPPYCNPVDTAAIAAAPSATPPIPVAIPARTAYENSYAKALWTASILANPPTKTIIKKIKSDGSSETGGKQLALRRFEISSTTNNSSAPHRTLKVGYQVWNWDGINFKNKNNGTPAAGDEPIAETYVEVIPDVALQCP